jgi:hypothetical protein
VAPADDNVVEVGGHDAAVGHRDVGELGRRRGGDADLVVVADRLAPLVHDHLVRADQAARVPHAELRRRQHQPRMLEAGGVSAEELQVGDHPPARLDLDRGEVVDLDAAVAGQPRAEEQRDVVVPAGVGRLQVAELLVALLHQRAVCLGIAALESHPLLEVDAAPRPRRVEAVLDVGALAFDVGLVGHAGRGAHVEVAAGVDDDLGEDRAPALLALEDHAAQLAPVGDDVDDPAVQQQPHAGLEQHLDRLVLQPLGVDHRRPRDDVAERAEALAPVLDRLGLGRSPLLGRRARDGALRQPVEDLGGEARDDLLALPVAHAIDPDHEAAGREAAEVVVALDERHAGAEPRRGHRRRAARRAAADDEHVGLLVDRRLARRLVDGLLRPVVAVVSWELGALGEPAVATQVVLLVLEVLPAGIVVRHGTPMVTTNALSDNLTIAALASPQR